MKRAVTILLSAAMVIAAISLCGCSKTKYYDYTGEIDNIVSVEMIDVTKTANNEAELEYEVIRSFDKSEWPEVLSDSAEIPHFFVYDPPSWQTGPALKIVFDEPLEGSLYVLVTKNKMVYAKQREGWIELDSYYSKCDYEQWNEFVAKYTDIDPE